MPNSAIGTGITLAFGTSAFACHLLDVGLDGVSRNAIQTSHMGSTGYHTYIVSALTDGGSLSIDFAYDPNDDPPVGAVAETITITFPPSQGTMTFTGFMTDFSFSAPFEDKMTASATIKVAGTITWPGSGTGSGS